MAVDDAVLDPRTENGRIPGRSEKPLGEGVSGGIGLPAEIRGMSFEEFLDSFGENDHVEWVGGEVIRMSPATDRHQDLLRFLFTLLNHHVEAHELGWLRSAPFVMWLDGPNRGREPDILFVTEEHRGRVKDTILDGPADLAVEIVSRDSVGRDRGEKFVEYEAAGVREYWLIDPLREQTEFYRLEDGRYRLVPPDADGWYRSTALEGFRLRPDWLWREPLPKVLDAARELGLLG